MSRKRGTQYKRRKRASPPPQVRQPLLAARARQRHPAPPTDGPAAIALSNSRDITITNCGVFGMPTFVRIEGEVEDLKMSRNVHIP